MAAEQSVKQDKAAVPDVKLTGSFILNRYVSDVEK